MDNRLEPEQREEYEIIMHAACFDPVTNKPYPTKELGWRVAAELDRADSMGKEWAAWFIEEDREVGHVKRAKRFRDQKYVVQVPDGERMATRAQIYSIPKVSGAGHIYYQPTLLQDMTHEELDALIAMDRQQLASARLNLRVHLRLKELMAEHPDAATVRDALAAIGTDIHKFLGSDADAA